MIQKSFIVQLRKGLHARPSGAIVSFISKLQLDDAIIEYNGNGHADCRSIISLMSLAVAYGETILVIVSGRDEQKAIEFFESFFSCDESEFYEKFSIQ